MCGAKNTTQIFSQTNNEDTQQYWLFKQSLMCIHIYFHQRASLPTKGHIFPLVSLLLSTAYLKTFITSTLTSPSATTSLSWLDISPIQFGNSLCNTILPDVCYGWCQISIPRKTTQFQVIHKHHYFIQYP